MCTNNSEINSHDYSQINFAPDLVEYCNHRHFNGELLYSLSQVETIISHPQDYPIAARKLGQWAYNTDGAIKSGINKMSTMHYLSYVLFSPSSKGKDELVLKNKQKFNATLRKIRYKNFLEIALREFRLKERLIITLMFKREIQVSENI